MQPQPTISQHILSKATNRLTYTVRSVFRKEENTQRLWNFEVGSQERIHVPIWIVVGFQQKNRLKSENDTQKDTFNSLPVTCAESIIRTDKKLDAGKFMKCNDDDYYQTMVILKRF